ncbi:RAD52 family DNA repair protein [Synechococcus sp. WH 8101]|uniref:RAD52 family DNA repair protein n=1 Tax=Synechococcus sp. WH 8101 TaxID=59932 RepID=UPI00102383E1|nr:RAD52 family DNA repair protein [Synechococcus sp. WH 8101]
MPRLPQRHPSALQLLRESLQQEGDATTPAPAAPPHVAAAPAVSGFSARQRELLAAPLDRAKVRQREQGRMRVSYLEGWQVIAEANRIFGFDGWDRLTLNASCVAEHERPVGRERKSGWGVTYTVRVRIVVIAGERCLIREGSGAGHGIDLDQGLAHESALKEAETDATKRALMSFGNAFGLALYDKQQRQVSSGREQGSATKTAQQQVEPVDAPLEPAVITGLQTRIKALPPSRLEAFSRGFRVAFQVPDTQPSLAGLITTSAHQRWIEGFLGLRSGA